MGAGFQPLCVCCDETQGFTLGCDGVGPLALEMVDQAGSSASSVWRLRVSR